MLLPLLKQLWQLQPSAQIGSANAQISSTCGSVMVTLIAMHSLQPTEAMLDLFMVQFVWCCNMLQESRHKSILLTRHLKLHANARRTCMAATPERDASRPNEA